MFFEGVVNYDTFASSLLLDVPVSFSASHKNLPIHSQLSQNVPNRAKYSHNLPFQSTLYPTVPRLTIPC